MSEENNVLKNGARLLGETFITPGASLLANGQIGHGLLHVGAGIIARMFLGVPGMMVVAANSYSKTVTGKHVLTHLTQSSAAKSIPAQAASVPVEPVATTVATTVTPTATPIATPQVAAETVTALPMTSEQSTATAQGKPNMRNLKNDA